MRIRALDADGDFTFGRGKANYLTDNAAIAQLVNTRVKSFLGDCFYDTQSGIDWFNLLGSKNKIALTLALNATILNTYGVTGINQLSSVLDSNRNLIVTYSISTIFPAGITGNLDLLLDQIGDL